MPVNNFSVMSGRNNSYYQYFRGEKCLAQGHNTVEVGFEPPELSLRRSTLLPVSCGGRKIKNLVLATHSSRVDIKSGRSVKQG